MLPLPKERLLSSVYLHGRVLALGLKINSTTLFTWLVYLSLLPVWCQFVRFYFFVIGVLPKRETKNYEQYWHHICGTILFQRVDCRSTSSIYMFPLEQYFWRTHWEQISSQKVFWQPSLIHRCAKEKLYRCTKYRGALFRSWSTIR